MSIIERALDECADALTTGIATGRRPEAKALKAFRGRFQKDFKEVLGGSNGEDIWKNDSPAITALAKAIGALAEHYAVSDKGAKKVRPQDLDRAFEKLKGECEVLVQNPHIRARYCEYARKSGKHAG